MEELNKVTSTNCTLMLGGREREIKYTFSVWATIEKEYKGFKNFTKQIDKDIEDKPFTVIPHLIWLGLKDREGLKEETLLDEYGMGEIHKIQDVLYNALYGSLPEDKKK